ncbi:hypothetical protein STEG23_016251 [Scotinomys teguina]
MCRLSWFLDPGGWSKAAVVGLYFIFPGISTCPFFWSRKASVWNVLEEHRVPAVLMLVLFSVLVMILAFWDSGQWHFCASDDIKCSSSITKTISVSKPPSLHTFSHPACALFH